MGEIDLELGRGKGDGPHVPTCIHPGLNTHIRAFLGIVMKLIGRAKEFWYSNEKLHLKRNKLTITN